MDVNLDDFKNNIDSWVKEINQKVQKIEETNNLGLQTVDDIEHNYELIFELKDEMETLKHEIRELKMMQLISLKSRSLPEIKQGEQTRKKILR